MVTYRGRLAVLVGMTLAGAAGAQTQTDPALDPNYQPDPAATDGSQTAPASPGGTSGGQQAPAVVTPQTGAPQTGTTSPGATQGSPGVHPATVTTPVDPQDQVLVAPPPGWQLARPVYLNGALYYAVHDADAYLAQAGWRFTPVVHYKTQTGFRFDLIRVPPSRAGATRSTIARNGSGIAIDTGVGVRTGIGRGIDPWVWGTRYVSNRGGRYVGPIDGQLSPGYAPPIPEPEPVVLTLEERAGLELGYGDAERAIALYREHLEADPEDMGAVRGLGVALLAADRPEDAIATIRYAYVTDPSLANDPMGTWIGGDDVREVRALVNRAVRHANRVESASAWLTVAVLMQAEGRVGPGEKMLERAAELGLDLEVARAMRGALTRR